MAAYRLPNDAFKANAGTDVVTDIIILRKKDGKPFAAAQDWTNLGDATTRGGESIRINEYFTRHPGHILGLLDNDGSMFAGRAGDEKEMTVHSDPNLPAPVAIQQALATLPEGVFGADGTASNARTYASTLKMGSIVNREGTYFFQGQDSPAADLNNPKHAARVRDFLNLRDALNRQYDLELSEESTEEEIEGNRRALNAAYDSFKQRHGQIHDRANKLLFIDDPDFFRLAGAEVEKSRDKGIAATIADLAAMVGGRAKQEYVKADIFRKRVLEPRSEPTSAASLEDAFGISLGWRGRVDTAFIADLIGEDPSRVDRMLVDREIAVRDPETGQVLTREQYLSGNVRRKLEVAKASGPDYERNARLLEAVQPQEVTIEDARFKIGATWIPSDVYSGFLDSIGIPGVKISYHSVSGGMGADRWEVDSKKSTRRGVEYKNYKTAAIDTPDIMEALLNMRRITITGKDSDGKVFTDDAATAAAREAAKKLNEAFISWVHRETAVGSRLAAIYNREVNAYAQRTYDGQFLTFPWANKDFDIFPDKKNTIWRAIQEGFGLIAHGVGGGKTILGSAIALEMRRLGMARKPMIVVHNATLEGFAKEIAKMAPTARVLVGRKDELQGDKRREFLMRIAAGDWDAVIVAHSTFGLIEDDPAVEIRHMENLVDEMMSTLNDKGYTTLDDAIEDRRKDPSVKNLVKQIERLLTGIKKANERKTDEGLLNFQQLGIDALIVDEVHQFKKMPFSTKIEAKGIDGAFSKRGYALLMRARTIQERMGGKNVFTMTGTPVTNTLGEIWNMVRLVAPNLLRDYRMENFDQFVSKFAEVETVSEMGPTGEFKNVERLSKVVNLPEWATFLRLAADVKLGDELVVRNRPGIKGGKPALVPVPRSAGVGKWVEYIRAVLDKFAALDGKDIAENPRLGAIPVQAFMASRAAAIDIRLVEPRAKDEPNSKVNLMLDRLLEIYERTTPYKGSQVIFADSFNQQKITLFDALVSMGSLDIELDPSKEPGTTFNLYDDIREKLIARGVPAEEIAVITDKQWNTDKKKQALFEMVNAGQVRVIIGSTQRLGTGVNMQQRMAAGHHLDVPWTPADLEQRDGRIFRQGNIHGEMGVDIELIRYGMKDTLDAALWQKLETKQRFTTLALSGKISGRELEEADEVMTLAEQRAVLSGPYGQQIFELETRIKELNTSFSGHKQQEEDRRREIDAGKNHIRIFESGLERIRPSLDKMQRVADAIARDGVQIAVDGQTYDSKSATSDVIKTAIEASRGLMPITSIAANNIPIYLHPASRRVVGEEKPIIEFMLLTGFGDTLEDLSFGKVTSPATLFARLEELGDTVSDILGGKERNIARSRQIAEMEPLGPWPYADEYRQAEEKLAELRLKVKGGEQLQARGRAVTDPNQEIFDFDAIPEDIPAAESDASMDPAARFRAELPQAMQIAAGYGNIPGVDLDEVRQTARLALADAARKFDGGTIPLVHGERRRDEHLESAGLQLRESFPEKVVMQILHGAAHGFECLIDDGHVGERNIGNREVNRVVGDVGCLEAGVLNVGLGIEGAKNPSGECVELHSMQAGAIGNGFRHEPEEVPNSCAGLEDGSALEPKALHGCPHSGNNLRAGVVSVDRAAFRCAILVLGQQSTNLLVVLAPLIPPVLKALGLFLLSIGLTAEIFRRVGVGLRPGPHVGGSAAACLDLAVGNGIGLGIVEDLGDCPPAGKFRQPGFLLCRGVATLRVDRLYGLDRFDIRPQLGNDATRREVLAWGDSMIPGRISDGRTLDYSRALRAAALSSGLSGVSSGSSSSGIGNRSFRTSVSSSSRPVRCRSCTALLSRNVRASSGVFSHSRIELGLALSRNEFKQVSQASLARSPLRSACVSSPRSTL